MATSIFLPDLIAEIVVDLHIGFDELLSDLPLDLFGRMVEPEVIDLFFPHPYFVDIAIVVQDMSHLVREELVEIVLFDLNPEI